MNEFSAHIVYDRGRGDAARDRLAASYWTKEAHIAGLRVVASTAFLKARERAEKAGERPSHQNLWVDDTVALYEDVKLMHPAFGAMFDMEPHRAGVEAVWYRCSLLGSGAAID